MGYQKSIYILAKMLPIKKGNFLVTGATGLIGSCIVDTLIEANKIGCSFNIYALSRNEKKVKARFGDAVNAIVQNIVDPIDPKLKFDYIIHCASNADPRNYAIYPVETIMTNISGNKNVLEYCKEHKSTRMLLTSTFEVYGRVEGKSVYKEEMSGIIDQNILRNCYPESKRTAELLLKSYVEEYGVNAVIARLSSVYGPTMLMADSKAHAQFIKNMLNEEDIVLKSKGAQIRSYSYVIDAVSGIFAVLFKGNKGEIYNISNDNSISSIAEVAKVCAEIANTNVVFDLPDEIENKGFSIANNCILDNTKLKNLGWSGQFSLKEGMKETYEYLKK